ncbi:MAG: type III-A CRISPR-associated RAMP protein Csm3 [Candidatus Dadabacteria bacterium]|nr:MAG: type III-A CRISPR-associated RAMP protein Csm3 [Candidatus Dadabacteria bacterium]
MKLQKIKKLEGTITVLTGLHIGAGNQEVRIGGTDQTVVKNPLTGEPYIPGSSIKGKVRSLLEMESGLLHHTGGKPFSLNMLNNGLNGDERARCEQILKLFGASGDMEQSGETPLGPSRASFSDCSLTDECRARIRDRMATFTEIKAENSIDRIKGVAVSPRFIERIPAGMEFNFSVSLKVFEGDQGLEDLLLKGLKLMTLDALGGNGSRGYGRVSIEFTNQELNEKFQQMQEF